MSDYTLQLYNSKGQRKFLTHEEVEAFLVTLNNAKPQIQTICLVLAHTGCHVSEALSLTASQIDIPGECIIFKSLNKRQPRISRAIPVKKHLLNTLESVHEITKAQANKSRGAKTKLWSYSREHVSREIKSYMKEAGIEGPQANPRGLRHAFGVRAIATGFPIETLSQWMGHGSPEVTERYATMIDEYHPPSASDEWF